MIYPITVWMSLGAAFVMAVLFLITQKYVGLQETRYFRILAVLTTVWALLLVIDAPMDDLEEKILIMKMKFLVMPYVSAAVFGLLASYGRRDGWPSIRLVAVLTIPLVITSVMGLTAEYHQLFLYDFWVNDTTYGLFLESTEGPWFTIYLAYSYILMAAGLAFLLAKAWRGTSQFRKQAAIMVFAVSVPVFMDILANSNFLPMNGGNLTPSSFAISGLIMIWGLYRYRVLDVLPVARSEMVEHMTDVLLVTDREGRLADFNHAASAVLRRDQDVIGRPLIEVVPFDQAFASRLVAGESFRSEVSLGPNDGRKVFEASVMPVMVRGKVRGIMVLLRDITERKRIEEALHTANARLGLLSSITRHDLINKLTAMEGYVTLAKREKDQEKAREYLNRFDGVSSAARSLINFTKDYESMGLSEPAWYSVEELLLKASKSLELGLVEISASVPGLQVYADGMIEKAFYNLVDNSLRHGERVTSITLLGMDTPEGYLLIYQDDGVGISPRDRPRIFDRGFGKNTGLGLFLVREVLAITGITIKENGELGKGARFELLVPPGAYRFKRQPSPLASVDQRHELTTDAGNFIGVEEK